jgi:predicted DsbA family dithiol-disulfide isomerase
VVTVDVWTDIVCPWCYIGVHNLNVAAANGPPVQIRHHAFMLRPNTPKEGIDIHEMLRRSYGADPRAMQARPEAMARAGGLELDLSKQRRMVPTAAAHALVRHASEPSGLIRDLFATYFDEAKDVSDPDVLASVAVRHGFTDAGARAIVTDPAELKLSTEQAQQAAAKGIRGVPYFVFANRFAASGAQPADVLRSAIARAVGF